MSVYPDEIMYIVTINYIGNIIQIPKHIGQIDLGHHIHMPEQIITSGVPIGYTVHAITQYTLF